MSLYSVKEQKEKDAFDELRKRMKDAISREMYEDSLLFYRFLKARNFDVDKAESMLRKHLIWRKVYQIDSFLQDFKPSPVFLKYINGSYIGVDKDGGIVTFFPGGKVETKEVFKCFKSNDYFKHWIWVIEKHIDKLKEVNAKTGKNSYKFSYIVDFGDLTLANATNPQSAIHYMRIAQIYQDNYPERLKAFYVINASPYFLLLYSIVKRILAEEVVNKVKVFGKTGWKEELLNVIDADVLPAFLGGNRTDPDGDPLCKSFINHDCKIPPTCYLSKEDRAFQNKSRVQRIPIAPHENHEVFVEVNKSGSIIEWEFEVKNKDIGFGLFFKESEEKRTEILPIHKFETSDGSENGSYRCKQPGTYILIFDNSYSWMNTKELSYYVTVKNEKIEDYQDE